MGNKARTWKEVVEKKIRKNRERHLANVEKRKQAALSKTTQRKKEKSHLAEGEVPKKEFTPEEKQKIYQLRALGHLLPPLTLTDEERENIRLVRKGHKPAGRLTPKQLAKAWHTQIFRIQKIINEVRNITPKGTARCIFDGKAPRKPAMETTFNRPKEYHKVFLYTTDDPVKALFQELEQHTFFHQVQVHTDFCHLASVLELTAGKSSSW